MENEENTQVSARPTLPVGTRQSILGASDSSTTLVEVPEWNCSVWVRGLTAGERDVWERLTTGRLSEEECKRQFKGAKLGPAHSRALLVFYASLVGESDESGRMFVDPTDMYMLARKQAAAVTRVAEAIVKLSGINDEDIAELEAEYNTNPTKEGSTSSAKSSRFGMSSGGKTE